MSNKVQKSSRKLMANRIGKTRRKSNTRAIRKLHVKNLERQLALKQQEELAKKEASPAGSNG